MWNPRKRLRQLTSLEEGESVDWLDGEKEKEMDDADNEAKALQDLKVRPVSGRVTRSRALLSAVVLTGKSTNGNVVTNAQARRTRWRSRTQGKDAGITVNATNRGKRRRDVVLEEQGEEKEDQAEEEGKAKEGTRVKRRRQAGPRGKKKDSLMAELELETDKVKRGRVTLTEVVVNNHELSVSPVACRGCGSSQRPKKLSNSQAPLRPKPITSKPASIGQDVVLEDLDDLIQEWNSDGIEDDEDEIFNMVGTQVTNVVEVKTDIIGGSLPPTTSQQQKKKLLPLLRQPRAPSPPSPDLALPWTRRHSPVSSTGLAIHSKKVAEVSTWLRSVYEGRSKKRVLVLKGPAGCGKTATLEALAQEGGWEILEWVNPMGGGGGLEGAADSARWKLTTNTGEGFANMFEDWLFRGGTWNCLELSSSSSVTGSTLPGSNRRQLLLIEDLPNISHLGTLSSFRTAIRSYLALPSPQPGSSNKPVPPLVIIVSEISENVGSSTAMGMSVHKIFGPQILSHPFLSEIQFRKVARTLLVKCMEEVLRRERYTNLFGKDVLDALAECGDLRSSINALEMLVLGKAKRAVSTKPKSAKRKKTPLPSAIGAELLALLVPRLSYAGIFHTIAKVVFNKRFGDDPTDPYYPPPPAPPEELLRVHRYQSRAMKLDPNTILDESGIDAGTFIYGIQENYLGSCNSIGGFSRRTLEEILEDVCFCAEALSEGDIFLGGYASHGNFSGDIGAGISRVTSWSWSTRGEPHLGDGVLRQEDIATQVVVRSMALGLPSPVKRDNSSSGGFSRGGPYGSQSENGGRNGNAWAWAKMYYPMGLRLWKVKEETEGVVELWEGRVREGLGLNNAVSSASSLSARPASMIRFTKAELVLERLPYMAKIAKGKTGGAGISTGVVGAERWPTTGTNPFGHNTYNSLTANSLAHTRASPAIIHSLERATAFCGIRAQPSPQTEVETELEDDETEGDTLAIPSQNLMSLFDNDEEISDRLLMPPPPVSAVKNNGKSIGKSVGGQAIGTVGLGVGALVLEEDDIEDDDAW